MSPLSTESVQEPAGLLLDLAHTALGAVHGTAVVGRALHERTRQGPHYVVAVGKAANAMLDGAVDALGDRLRAGYLVTRDGALGVRRVPSVEYKEAGHPLPDQRSVDAGMGLLRFLKRVPADAQLLFLISGGASSLVEVPVSPLNLDDLRRLNKWLLASGLAIDEVNKIRKRFSAIKGGRLLAYCGDRKPLGLLISDVPTDFVGDIGSGLLAPEDACSELEVAGWPDWLVDMHKRCGSVPVPEHAVAELVIVASNRDARNSVVQAARDRHLAVHHYSDLVVGDAIEQGRRIASFLRSAAPGIHVWGGETTVKLPAEVGSGGRNQAFCLAAATTLDGCDDVTLLSIGTDGSDGSTDDAGAWVNGETVEQGRREGLDADDCLRRADSGTFLAATGNVIHTGPTGTNVMDLVLAYKGSARQ